VPFIPASQEMVWAYTTAPEACTTPAVATATVSDAEI